MVVNGFSPSAFAVQPNIYLSLFLDIDGTENLGKQSGSLRVRSITTTRVVCFRPDVYLQLRSTSGTGLS